MSCNRGKASPNSHTKIRLFADSAGFCQNPGCNRPLFMDVQDGNIHIAEMAHIFSASDGGARTNSRLTKEERGNYNNLILLCANCHTMIDKAETSFPDNLIKGWKTTHSERVKAIFQVPKCNTRQECKKLIDPILMENRTIFEKNGPMTDERFNPESESPILWRRKITENILPNNRKILAILDVNRDLLNASEKQVLEELRQHVSDFEAKHIGESSVSGARFPSEANDLLGD